MTPAPDGLLLIDKPSGPTSHDIVNWVRRWTGVRRVGHAGTLDPLASGLLPVLVGRATRLVRFLPRSPKVYEGRLRLGLTTDTDDSDGQVVARHAGALPTPEAVRRAAAAELGCRLQAPPAFSARRVGGRRLYDLARRGEVAEAPPREVTVSRFDVEPTGGPQDLDFVAEVSSGTYVRALVRDLGRTLGCGAVLTALRRTRIGPLAVDRALRPPAPPDSPAAEVLRRALVPLERMPLELPAVRLPDEAAAERFAHGGAVRLEAGVAPAEAVRVEAPGGALLGVALLRDGRVVPQVVVRPPMPADHGN